MVWVSFSPGPDFAVFLDQSLVGILHPWCVLFNAKLRTDDNHNSTATKQPFSEQRSDINVKKNSLLDDANAL